MSGFDIAPIFDEGAWMEVYPQDERIGSLRLKIKAMDFIEFQEMANLPEEKESKAIDKLAEIITDWNLERDGKKIKCTKENKKRYLLHLLRLKVRESQNGSSPLKTTGELAIRFCQDIENYAKN